MSNLRVFSEALPRESSGVFQVQNQFTGRSSIVAYRNVENFPLIVTVALDRNEALAGWRRFVRVVALANFLVGALLLLLYSVVARRRLARQLANQKALVTEKLEAVDRKRGVWGKSESVSVDLGARRLIKKKNQTQHPN